MNRISNKFVLEAGTNRHGNCYLPRKKQWSFNLYPLLDMFLRLSIDQREFNM